MNAVSAFAQTAPTLSCASLSSELNTGVLSGTPLGLYQPDPIWAQFQERTVTPQTPPPNSSAWVQARTTGAIDGVWSTFTDAQWLSPGYPSRSGVYIQSASGDWWPRPMAATTPFYNHYRVQFNLSPEVPPSAVSFELEYMGDDTVTAAYVNGNAVSPFTSAGFVSGVYTTMNSGWVAGANSLIFTTGDTGWSAGFLMRARTAGQSICSVSPISITKTANQASYVPGDTASYTVTVANIGLVNATGASLADPVPAGLANPVWTCATASGTAACPAPATPGITFDLPGQSSLVFTLTGTVTGRDTLDNTATIAPGTGGVCAATTGCSATVTPSYTASQTSPISITKTANQANYRPGETARYAITVTNEWTVNATGVVLTDPTPPGITGASWSCTPATGSAVCPNPPTPGTPFNLPGRSSLLFTLEGTVTGRASLENTATITPGAGGECSPATGCSATASPTYTPAPAPAPAHPVPTVGYGALAALAAFIGFMAWRRRKPQM